MRTLAAVIQKELLMLLRDKAGLLVLFLMPAVLVVVITVVQENVLKTIGESDATVLLIDEDGGALGRQIAEALVAAPGVTVTQRLDGRTPDRRQALSLVAEGGYQLCLILPPRLTQTVRARARQSARDLMSGTAGAPSPPPAVEIYFEPTVLGGFRSAVNNLLELMLYRLEVAEKFAALAELLPGRPGRLDGAPPAPEWRWPEAPLVRIEAQDAAAGGRPAIPTAVQQNVPAYTLFGIFFIVLPMAGAFIQERLNGTRQRLAAAPVSDLTLVGGRIVAYTVVCLGQCLLIGCIGRWVLPLLGTAPLTLGGSAAALALVIASAILAATGYGILLGTLVNSFEQAAMVGPISIVIAAALGGIMVPVYAMPPVMQTISIVSPLAWGLNGALDIFVRGSGVTAVLPEAASLGAFSAGCILVAWGWQHRRRRRGGGA